MQVYNAMQLKAGAKSETNRMGSLTQPLQFISKIDKTEEEFIIEPIDNTKEIVVNGKTYKNVKIRHKKTKDNSLHINQKKVSKNALKQQIKHSKQVVSTSKVSKEKKIDKEKICKFSC